MKEGLDNMTDVPEYYLDHAHLSTGSSGDKSGTHTHTFGHGCIAHSHQANTCRMKPSDKTWYFLLLILIANFFKTFCAKKSSIIDTFLSESNIMCAKTKRSTNSLETFANNPLRNCEKKKLIILVSKQCCSKVVINRKRMLYLG